MQSLPGVFLHGLVEAVVDSIGPRAAEDLMFRVGCDWGRTEAESLRPADGDTGRWLHLGSERLAKLGLGAAGFLVGEGPEASEHRLRCEVRECRGPGHHSTGGAGPVCGLMTGYLTGLACAVRGEALDCDLRECPAESAGEIRVCTLEWIPRPEGEIEKDGGNSARTRFHLGSLGIHLGQHDIALDDLLENTTDAIVLIGSDNVISFWNRGAERMFLYPREECVGRKIGFIVPPDLLEEDELGWLEGRLDAEGFVSNHVTRRVRKDGTELCVSLTRTLLHDTAGNVIGSTATIRDITQMRRTEEELEKTRSLAMVGEMAARVAHEMKNPLAGIYGAIQLLARDVQPEDPRKEVFEDVAQAVRRLDATILDLLQFARPAPLKQRDTGLRNLVGEILERLRLDENLLRHRVELDVDEDLVLPLDTRGMEQVLTNLILNAAQAMEKPGKIRIRSSVGDDVCILEVADSGPGIPAEQLESVFDPFFTTKVRGTGLGLSIARKIALAHGGNIQVRSGGEGTVFAVTLPLRADSASSLPDA